MKAFLDDYTMIRLGLCCTFHDQPIRFANTTATAIGRMSHSDALAKLGSLCLQNASALLAALRFGADHGMAAFGSTARSSPSRRIESSDTT